MTIDNKKIIGKYISMKDDKDATCKFKFEIGHHFLDENRDITILDHGFMFVAKKDNRYEKCVIRTPRVKHYKYYCNRCNEETIVDGSRFERGKQLCGKCFITNNVKYDIELGTVFKDEHRYLTVVGRKMERTVVAIDGKTKTTTEKYYKYYCNKCGNEHWIEESNLKSGKGCRRCMYIRDLKYKFEIGHIFGKKMNLEIVDRHFTIEQTKHGEKKRKFYEYKCLDCGDTDTISEEKLQYRNDCLVCGKMIKKIVAGINDIMTTHPLVAINIKNEEDRYKYTSSSNETVLFKCVKCDYERSQMIIKATQNGVYNCPCCDDGVSYPEKFMIGLLKQLNIEYQTQLSSTTFDWIVNGYKYDFYIPSLNIIIETHGLQHYEQCKGSFDKPLEEQQKIDYEKLELALNNGFTDAEYIVIDCRYSKSDYIKNNILSSDKMNKYFDLSNIDWSLCLKETATSNVKMACELKKDYPKLSVSDIAILLDLSKGSVTDYLKKGSESGLCDYKVGENEVTILCKGSSIPVGVYKDDKLIKRYDSAVQMIEFSEQDLGVRFAKTVKRFVGKGKEYKGFIINKSEKKQLSTNEKKGILVNYYNIDLKKFNINIVNEKM